jgi:hypothetical protein
MNLVKMNTELGIVKIELNNTRTHLANRLEGIVPKYFELFRNISKN